MNESVLGHKSDVRIIVGDCRQVMAELEPGSVQMCVTSPPYYGLRDYGIEPSVWGGEDGCDHEWGDESHIRKNGNTSETYSAKQGSNSGAVLTIGQGQLCLHCTAWLGTLGLEPTPELFIEHMVEVFRGVWRVLRDDGTLWMNLGDSYAGSGKGPTGHNGIGDQEERQGFTGGGHRHGAESHDWIEDGQVKKKGMTRVGPVAGYKAKDLMMMPARVALALQADGWYLRSDIIWHKPNPMPESVTDRPTTSHEHIFLMSKSQKYYYDADAIREAATTPFHSVGGYREGNIDNNHRPTEYRDASRDQVGRNRRSVWTVPTQPYAEAHFATYPEDLIRPCILAGTSEAGCCAECGAPLVREVEVEDRGFIYRTFRSVHQTATAWNTNAHGKTTLAKCIVRTTNGFKASCECNAGTTPGVVLDPFGGSGTTGKVARHEGRRAILIELKREYAELAMSRISKQAERLL